MRLLVTHVETEAGQALVASLEHSEWTVFAASHVSDCAALLSCPPERRVHTPAPGRKGFLEAIRGACQSQKIRLVAPAKGAGLKTLLANRWLLELAGIRLLCGDLQSLALCSDRFKMFQACDGAVPTPVIRFNRRAGGTIFPSLQSVPCGSNERMMESESFGPELSVYLHRSRTGGVRIIGAAGLKVLGLTTRLLVHGLAEAAAARLMVRGPVTVVFRRDRHGRPVLEDARPWFDGTLDPDAIAVGATISDFFRRPPITSNIRYRLLSSGGGRSYRGSPLGHGDHAA